jgi:hypothetical protein
MDKREAIVDWVIELYHGEKNVNRHYFECPKVNVRFEDAYDGDYGCDTGCEYYRVAGVIYCPHVEGSFSFDYGDFGQMMDHVPGIDSYVGYSEIDE